ncbi:MAG: hypothetical protein ABIR28_05505 [Vicinamibacteria bacterium]
MTLTIVSSVFVLSAPPPAFATPAAQASPPTSSAGRPMLVARLSRWQGDPVKKRKGPKGFDLAFQLVGSRFDGAFGVEGLPQLVPEGEAFDAQIKLTNLGKQKNIKVSSVTVTGDGLTLTTEVLIRQVDPKTSQLVASFKVPPQSFAGSSFLITVVLSNGDRHRATLTFARPS